MENSPNIEVLSSILIVPTYKRIEKFDSLKNLGIYVMSIKFINLFRAVGSNFT